MLTLPLSAPSLRTANRLPGRRVLRRIHHDLIRIMLLPLRRGMPTANQIFSLFSGRRGTWRWCLSRHSISLARAVLADRRVSWLTDADPRLVHIWDVGELRMPRRRE